MGQLKVGDTLPQLDWYMIADNNPQVRYNQLVQAYEHSKSEAIYYGGITYWLLWIAIILPLFYRLLNSLAESYDWVYVQIKKKFHNVFVNLYYCLLVLLGWGILLTVIHLSNRNRHLQDLKQLKIELKQ